MENHLIKVRLRFNASPHFLWHLNVIKKAKRFFCNSIKVLLLFNWSLLAFSSGSLQLPEDFQKSLGKYCLLISFLSNIIYLSFLESDY